ncbi:hypothetical protein JCGZ_15513 [Jatropha curcas]|uniref:Uncharacterized protein n=1 Tax=Jatropha curcas TaxID=180498 RepID=A0A067K3U4_JATCU|nr:hypothetical protein JCGZ_15513 [Jatropha curcas]
MSRKQCDEIRKQWHIIVDGEDIPPQIKNFREIRFPEPILKKLKAKGCAAYSRLGSRTSGYLNWKGQDWNISYRVWEDTCFCAANDYEALQEEIMMPIATEEGPFGSIICPSRELARQTYEVVEQFLIL